MMTLTLSADQVAVIQEALASRGSDLQSNIDACEHPLRAECDDCRRWARELEANNALIDSIEDQSNRTSRKAA